MSLLRGPKKMLLAAMFAAMAFFVHALAHAQIAHMPKEMRDVGVNEHLDEKLPLDTPFRDHTGKAVKLGDYFDGRRPVVITFAYHTCPVVCSMIAHNVAAGLKGVGWTLGDEYTALTISIDPEESLERTGAKRTTVLHEYGRSGSGWNFLVGDSAAIAKVAAAAGFQYQYDEEQKQWAHASVAMIAKPDGRMARYLYGYEFNSVDLKLALLEASEGRHISTVEKIILYCYHYDPKGGKYALVARRVMQVGASGVAVALITVLALFWVRELRKGARRGARLETKKKHDDIETETEPRASHAA